MAWGCKEVEDTVPAERPWHGMGKPFPGGRAVCFSFSPTGFHLFIHLDLSSSSRGQSFGASVIV